MPIARAILSQARALVLVLVASVGRTLPGQHHHYPARDAVNAVVSWEEASCRASGPSTRPVCAYFRLSRRTQATSASAQRHLTGDDHIVSWQQPRLPHAAYQATLDRRCRHAKHHPLMITHADFSAHSAAILSAGAPALGSSVQTMTGSFLRSKGLNIFGGFLAIASVVSYDCFGPLFGPP